MTTWLPCDNRATLWQQELFFGRTGYLMAAGLPIGTTEVPCDRRATIWDNIATFSYSRTTPCQHGYPSRQEGSPLDNMATSQDKRVTSWQGYRLVQQVYLVTAWLPLGTTGLRPDNKAISGPQGYLVTARLPLETKGLTLGTIGLTLLMANVDGIALWLPL